AGHRRSAVSGVPGFIDLVLTVFGVIVLLLCALASLLALRNEGLIEQHLPVAGTANLAHWPARLALRGIQLFAQSTLEHARRVDPSAPQGPAVSEQPPERRSTAVTAPLDQHQVTRLTALISSPRPEEPALIPTCLNHVGFRRWLACRTPTVDSLRRVCDTQPGELCDIHVYRDRSDGSWCVLYERSEPRQSTVKDPGSSVLFERIVILVAEWNAAGRATHPDQLPPTVPGLTRRQKAVGTRE
ncbi:MAG: hypothetical protein ACRDQ5_07450, partial [Sciscionella sp.]